MQLAANEMHKMGRLLCPPIYGQHAEYTLLLARTQSGLGDWVMLLDIVTMLNDQYPNIAVYVDTDNMPAGFSGFIAGWDITCTPVTNPNPNKYDYYSGHLIYPAPEASGGHFIAGMVRTLNMRTGLNLRFDVNRLAVYRLKHRPGVARPYVVMSLKSTNPAKELPVKDAIQITNRVSAVAPIISTEGMCLAELGTAIHGACCVIALEDGISHLAGHMSKPCMTYYSDSATSPLHTGYRNQIPVNAARLKTTAAGWVSKLVTAAKEAKV